MHGAIRAGVAAVLLSAGTALAADETKDETSYPNVEHTLAVELEADHTYRSDNPDNKRSIGFAKAELASTLHLTEAFSVLAIVKFEPVNDPTPGRDSWFGEQGLFLDTLAADYDDGLLLGTAGKFTQNFGIAWDLAPGIWGNSFAEDYELSERWGLRAGAQGDAGDWGKHSVTASAFFRDTTALSDSAFTRRGRLRRSDGGPANTESPKSFNLALDSEEFVVVPGLRTHLAYLHQARGVGNDAAEKGIAIGAAWEIELAEEWTLTPIVEHARFHDFGGSDGARARYLTAGGELRYGPWNLAVVQAWRDAREPGSDEVRDRLFQITGGYKFDFGLGIDAGWFATRTDGVDDRGVGVRLVYETEF